MNFIYDTAPPVHMLLIEAVAHVVGWEHKLNTYNNRLEGTLPAPLSLDVIPRKIIFT